MTINPATYSKLPYHPQRDFAPVSMICSFPLKARDLEKYTAVARAANIRND